MKRFTPLLVFLTILCAALAYFLLREQVPAAVENVAEAKSNRHEPPTITKSESLEEQRSTSATVAPVDESAKTENKPFKDDTPPAHKDADLPIEAAPSAEPEETKAPEEPSVADKSPELVAAESMVRSLGEFLNASTFCEAPFLMDGREELEDLVKVQDFFDSATRKASGRMATFTLDTFSSVPAAAAKESDDELIKLCIGNRRFAKLSDYAERFGGKFGAMRVTRTIDGVEKQEVVALAFNKDGKLIGFAD